MPLGNHVNKDGEKMHHAILTTIDTADAHKVRLECAQIFAIGPRNNRENLSAEEKENIRKMTSNGLARIYIHSSYLSNPWGKKSEFGMSLVRRELAICEEIGGRGVVVHLARKPPAEIAKMVPRLLQANTGADADASNETPTRAPSRAILFLEIESYKPLERDTYAIAHELPASADIECTYETPHKLKQLTQALIKEGVDMDRVGICIDTAHLWAAGAYIASYHNMKNWLGEFPPEIKNIMVHLNDQIWSLGGGKDEHAPLLLGTIWGKYNPNTGTDSPQQSGLQAILEWSVENNIDMIMERKDTSPAFKDQEGKKIYNIRSDYQMISGMGFGRNDSE